MHTNPMENFKKETAGGYDSNLVLVLDKAVSTEAEVTALGIRCGEHISH